MVLSELRVAKRIMSFQPSALRSVEACERHYLDVHRHWAVEALGSDPRLLGYATTRLEAQWDMAGRFCAQPDLWRYAAMRFVSPGVEFSPEVTRMLAHDHQNFLKDLRRFDVIEEVVVDLVAGQLTSTKYVVLVDRPAQAVEGDGAASAAEELVRHLSLLIQDAYGARRMIVNRVVRERENVAMREEGQLPTGRVLATTDRLLVLELYFDDSDWGDAFFASTPVLDLLRTSVFAPSSMKAYRASERVAHDRRPELHVR